MCDIMSLKQYVIKKIFFWNWFKDDRFVNGFQDYCCDNVENENTLAIDMRTHFTEAAIERCPLNLYLGSILEII